MSNTLLRLTTTNSLAVFDEDLYEDLVIKKNSSIALQNLTILQTPVNFLVDATNDEIKFKIIDGDPEMTAKLSNVSYNESNINDLVSDINQQMNSVLINTNPATQADTPLVGKYNGSEYNAVFVGNTFQISYKKTNFYTPTLTQVDVEAQHVSYATTNNGTFTRNGGTEGNLDSYVYSTTPFVMGAGAIKAKIFNLSSAKQPVATKPVKIIFGLSEINPSNMKNAMDVSKIKYGIILKNNNENYDILIDGNVQTTNKTCVNTNSMTFELYKGSIKCRIYSNNNNRQATLFDVPYTYGQNLYPIILFERTNFGDAGNEVSLNVVNFMRNQFYSPSSTFKEDNGIDEPSTLGANIPINGGGNSTMSLDLSNCVSLAEFLGYTTTLFRYPNIGNSVVFAAQEQFTGIFRPESVVVELMNLPLKSYDFTEHRRRSILSVIPNFSNGNNKLIYEANIPLYIDIDNSSDIFLRNIKARVLNSDLSEIQLNGFITMTLLVKSNKVLE